MYKFCATLSFVLISFLSFGQPNTVGLQYQSANSFDGYTLFAPMAHTETYLIDNCGREINSWASTYEPGLSAYLLENGTLLKSIEVGNTTFTNGGNGGGVEIMDWDGNLTWTYIVSSTSQCQHHDVEMLPNGNVLMIVWEAVGTSVAIANGRDPNNLNANFWPDKIIEVQPSGPTTGNIVWEWHAMDHLIQDYDQTKANYGVVADNQQLININYPPNQSANDWLHTNGIDYNPTLDQIVLSVLKTDELWVIDHSTTTAEAAGHTGGNTGKGGDLLYRWGNPAAYDCGTANDQKFFGQHDAQWITDGLDSGKLMIYNNGVGRFPTQHSSVDIVDPAIDGNGNYVFPTAGAAFDPPSLDWTFEGNPVGSFTSANISGVQRLPNENTLICVGREGLFFEIDSNENTVWSYLCPVGTSGPIPQGDPAQTTNTFRCYRYSPDYAGLAGQDLTPGTLIELNPNPDTCTLHPLPIGIEEEQIAEIAIYPNPVDVNLTVKFSELGHFETIEIFDSFGKMVKSVAIREQSAEVQLSVENLPAGYYTLQLLGRKITHSKRLLIY